MSKKFLTMSALQEKLHGRSRTSIYNDVRKGRLPKPIKLGARLFWDEAAVDAALSANPDK